jgi:hypothetical protein
MQTGLSKDGATAAEPPDRKFGEHVSGRAQPQYELPESGIQLCLKQPKVALCRSDCTPRD